VEVDYVIFLTLYPLATVHGVITQKTLDMFPHRHENLNPNYYDKFLSNNVTYLGKHIHTCALKL